ncbi:MAG: hypothetical protein IJ185_09950 [Prevotella sp.]|nr:hypothetical protein [Prevotella sp.]
MKQIIKSAIIAIVFTSGTVMLTSCDKVVEDTVEGLFKPLNDAAEEYAKERKQQNMDNLFNWRIGNETDQEAIDINSLRMVRCLTHSYNSFVIRGLICDKSIASDIARIFRELYDANYQIEDAATELERQGLSVTINAGKPLASDDLAVKLFKEKGFKWGGDEPGGDSNCFANR